MKFKSKPLTIEAFCFAGTVASAQEAHDWVSSHDIENAEVSCQGDREPLALDVMTGSGLRTLEAGDFIYTLNGELYAETAAAFNLRYERADK